MAGLLQKLAAQMSHAVHQHNNKEVLALLDRHPVLLHQKGGIAHHGNWLHEAVRHSNNALIEPLVQRGLSVHVRDEWRSTPLLTAVACSNLHAVHILLPLGADPLVKDHLGQTALYHAVHNDSEEIVRELLLKAPTVDTVCQGKTALLAAVGKSSIAIVRMLLQAGADPEFQQENGSNAMRIAEGKGDGDILELLRSRTQTNRAQRAIESVDAMDLKPLSFSAP